ncbi:hypothetical protein JZ751_024114 [Albula glossodonta]|uniref:Apoptosis facilitator Bcl-2-like protein 14 n=1 Tax=Albula glossodonta TaxID=121402 RepID=A0A8T2NFD7_9TELE|nr:hypothetical protein JZ751_024114 [Albula glossodonta]
MEAVGTNGALPEMSKDSMEFRLLMAYTKKRKQPIRLVAQGARFESAQVPDKRRKVKAERAYGAAAQTQRPVDEGLISEPWSLVTDEDGDTFLLLLISSGPSLVGTMAAPGVLDNVADKLTNLADSVKLESGDIEPDGPDDVIQRVVELLRESGDRLNEEMKKDETLAKTLRSCFTYSMFESVTSLFLDRVDPSSIPSTKTAEQAKIALTFEVTNRLTAVDCHPMNMLMGFGAKYLQDNFSTWVKQRGGWDKAFEDDEEVQ